MQILMLSPPQHLISRSDLNFALYFFLGFGGLWFFPYAGSRWFPGFFKTQIFVVLICVVVGLLGAVGCVLRPIISSPADTRAAQGPLRMIFLLAIVLLVVLKINSPNPAAEGNFHRLKDLGNPEEFRSFAKWIAEASAENPALAELDERQIQELLDLDEGGRFASISSVWGSPSSIFVESGPQPNSVCFGWGGGFGHWGVTVRFDALPVEATPYLEVWKWQEGLYFHRENQ